MTEPFLLTEKQARALLAGADPAKLAPPLYLGKRKYWSRAALDRAVCERAGLPVSGAAPAPADAYETWKQGEDAREHDARAQNHA